MSEGICGAHVFNDIDKAKLDLILMALKNYGAEVTGDNPWDVEDHDNGVKLQGIWNEAESILTVIVIDKPFFVPCSMIWDRIDPMIKDV